MTKKLWPLALVFSWLIFGCAIGPTVLSVPEDQRCEIYLGNGIRRIDLFDGKPVWSWNHKTDDPITIPAGRHTFELACQFFGDPRAQYYKYYMPYNAKKTVTGNFEAGHTYVIRADILKTTTLYDQYNSEHYSSPVMTPYIISIRNKDVTQYTIRDGNGNLPLDSRSRLNHVRTEHTAAVYLPKTTWVSEQGIKVVFNNEESASWVEGTDTASGPYTYNTNGTISFVFKSEKLNHQVNFSGYISEGLLILGKDNLVFTKGR
jgi:hypothetical protein